MSDTRLRELERRWKETNSPDDEAAYLLERVRVGDLTRERLELAAYCGHEGARRASESPVTFDFATDQRVQLDELRTVWREVSNWGRGLWRLSREAALWAAYLAALTALPKWNARHPEVHEPAISLAALREWLLCPSPDRALAVVQLGMAAEQAVADATLSLPPMNYQFAGFAAAYAAFCLASDAELAEMPVIRTAEDAMVETLSTASDVLENSSTLMHHLTPPLTEWLLDSKVPASGTQ